VPTEASLLHLRLGKTVIAGATSKTIVDDEERQALRAEALDPDDPAAASPR
jgi:hypothetical protein